MLEEINRSLGRIESKVDILLETRKNHGKRIRALEIKNWMIAGGVVVVGFVLKVVHVI